MGRKYIGERDPKSGNRQFVSTSGSSLPSGKSGKPVYTENRRGFGRETNLRLTKQGLKKS